MAVETNPLTGTGGKNQIVAEIRKQHPGRALLVGDGLSDMEVSDGVDLFVGFGGAVFRQRIADASPVYIFSPTLAPILPLALGQLGNTPRYAQLWANGLQRIYDDDVSFIDPKLRTSFLNALQR